MKDFNHPKNEEGVYTDLLEKYKKYGTLYIGVDFDNTLWPYDLSEDQEPPQGFKDVLELLRKAKSLGMKLCLWSLPMSAENLEWKIKWCKNHGIEMDYINESPLLYEYTKIFGKPHFNLLLDDTAGLESAYRILYRLCKEIQIAYEN